MPRLTHMTWVQRQRRWTKQYKGHTYSVSCRQLNAPDSKDGSWAAANRWWETKQAEVDAALKAAEPPPDATSEAVAGLLAAHGFKHVGELMLARDRGQAADRLLAMVRDAGGIGGAATGLEAVNAGRPVLPEMPLDEFQRFDAMLGPSPVPAVAGRSLKVHVDRWFASLRDRVAARTISADRRDRYERDIRKFLKWSGPGSQVDELNAAKLDGWHSHLAEIVGGGGSTETAKHAMMTVRQMVAWLAERGTIPLPGNIRSRSHVFGGVARKVNHYTCEEVKAILAAADGHSKKTKLYLLLMLNCGMYQNDVSELLHDEVGWDAGTITRKRSKRRGREDAQEVCYPLWADTFALLKRFRSKDARRALTTDEGKPLVKGEHEKSVEGGEDRFRRYDCVQSAFTTLKEKVEVRLGLKHFRKTSAQLLFENEKYRHLHQVFLAQAPKGVAARNYLDESRSPEFKKAIMWLGEQYGVET